MRADVFIYPQKSQLVSAWNWAPKTLLIKHQTSALVDGLWKQFGRNCCFSWYSKQSIMSGYFDAALIG